MVRRALAEVAENGLPGEHHFYVSFTTRAPGVSIPRFLFDLHPEEMTIVLQHQFWELEVDAEAFSVTLLFNGTRQRLTVPFAAVQAFADPAAEFGLRFDGLAAGEAAAAPAEPEARAEGAPMGGEPGPGGVLPFDRGRKH